MYCDNHQNVNIPLLLDWLVVDDPMQNLWEDFDDCDKNINDIIFFVLISKTLMFPCCFVHDSLVILWRDKFETLIISMETFLIFIVFDVLTSESFMFHCSFSDDSLMILLRNIDDTTKIWMQTLKVIDVSNVIIIRTLIFLCCLID